VKTKK